MSETGFELVKDTKQSRVETLLANKEKAKKKKDFLNQKFTSKFDDEKNLAMLKKIFYKKGKSFYPSYDQFMNEVKIDLGKNYMDANRQNLQKWYYAQKIVQVFAPFPLAEALKHKTGYYPKIISFFPFERLYVDTGSIGIFKYTKQQAKQIEKENKFVVVAPTEDTEKEVLSEEVVVPEKEEDIVPKTVPEGGKPKYEGKYPQYISVMETKKGSGKYVFYINKGRAKKLGLKFQDYKGTVEYLEDLIEKNLDKNKENAS